MLQNKDISSLPVPTWATPEKSCEQILAHFDKKYSHLEKTWRKNRYFSQIFIFQMIFVSVQSNNIGYCQYEPPTEEAVNLFSKF